jgi:hypothetical protein
MVNRSERTRQEVSRSDFTEIGIQPQTRSTVTCPRSPWLVAERAAVLTQLHNELEWSSEMDDILRELVDAAAPIDVICSRLKCSCDAVRARVLVLRLRVRPPV